jgi:hypothetical protein
MRPVKIATYVLIACLAFGQVLGSVCLLEAAQGDTLCCCADAVEAPASCDMEMCEAGSDAQAQDHAVTTTRLTQAGLTTAQPLQLAALPEFPQMQPQRFMTAAVPPDIYLLDCNFRL